MEKNIIRLSVFVEKELWEEWQMHQEAGSYIWVSDTEVRIRGSITRRHAELIHRKSIYGHHGIWLDPQNAIRNTSTHYVSGPVCVDVVKRQLWVHDQPVRLKPSDFMLLLFFLKHPHQVLFRESLIRFLEQRYRNSIQDNTLSVHVRRIRKAIVDPTLLKTVPRVGYMWTKDVKADKQGL